jgi:hypothetical protein
MNQQDEIDESVAGYDSENKAFYSNSPNNDIYNQFIIGIKFWQAYSIACISAYNGFLKAWSDNIRLTNSNTGNLLLSGCNVKKLALVISY